MAQERLTHLLNHLSPPSQPINDFVSSLQPHPTSSRFSGSELQAIQLFETSKQSVVFVSTRVVQIASRSLSPFSFLPQGDEIIRKEGTGSGFIWDSLGHVVTNAHVVRHVGEITVVLEDKREYKAILIGHDEKSDLAVLKIDELVPSHPGSNERVSPNQSFAPLKKGISKDLCVGQTVYAIGNPFGLHHTMTSGIISGLGRELPAQEGGLLTNLIQTDAPINPGNSGGPLLDSNGNLIGVTTAILSPTGTSNGLGFAVPVDFVKEIVEELIKHGKVVRPELGIFMAPDNFRVLLGIPNGVIVLGVKSKSPAAEAGIIPLRRARDGSVILGDVIVGISGKKIQNNEDLLKAMQGMKIGSEIDVEITRGMQKERITKKIRLQESHANK